MQEPKWRIGISMLGSSPDRFACRVGGPASRPAYICATVGVGCLLVLIVGLGVAAAAGTLPFLGSFGIEGESAGQFKVPRGVAVEGSSGPSKGDFYVADQNNQRVEEFDPVGRFILTFG